MRIRKRQVPLPLSDPLLFLPTIAKPSPSLIDSSASADELHLFHGVNQEPDETTVSEEEGLAAHYFPDEAKGISNNHSRCMDNAAEKATAGLSPVAMPASSSHEAFKRKLLSSNDDNNHDKDYKWDVMMKGSSSGNNCRKRRGRGGGGIGSGGGASSEGSRCSRVNGRGWKCGQQKLVGYSLCEHHLGKGRLRSMANVRGHSTIGVMEASSNGNKKSPQITTYQPPKPLLFSGMRSEGNIFLGDDEEEDDKEGLTSTRLRKKARSMSSLLRQGSDHDDHSASISLKLSKEIKMDSNKYMS